MTVRFPLEPGTSMWDLQPELSRRFKRYHGTLWSEGSLDNATMEVGRLRNAYVTDCAKCRSLRFSGAKEEGLTEDLVAQIGDDPSTTALPDRYKLAIRYADVILRDPASLDDVLRKELVAEFTPAEIVELTAVITISMGFSKASISWGRSGAIPLTDFPTPSPDD